MVILKSLMKMPITSTSKPSRTSSESHIKESLKPRRNSKMKAKREKDGYYYEKIVTWDICKENDLMLIIGPIVSLILFGLFIGGIVTKVSGEPTIFDLIFLLSTVIIVFIASLSSGLKREVKFKRIGK